MRIMGKSDNRQKYRSLFSCKKDDISRKRFFYVLSNFLDTFKDEWNQPKIRKMKCERN